MSTMTKRSRFVSITQVLSKLFPPSVWLMFLLASVYASENIMAQISWRNGPSQMRVRNEAEIKQDLLSLIPATGSAHVLVQCKQGLTSLNRLTMHKLGLTLLRSVGSDAYWARLAATADAIALGKMAMLQDVQPARIEWKLHPRLLANNPPVHTVNRQANPADPSVAVYVMFHRDVILKDKGRKVLDAHAARLYSYMRTIKAAVVDLPLSQIIALANEDSVQWVEPALPPFLAHNDDNRLRTGADIVQSPPLELDGSGVGVLVYDVDMVRPHVDFGGRSTQHEQVTSSSDHPTHVAGTIGGDGTMSGGLYKGMAPGVTIESYASSVVGGDEVWYFEEPGDLEENYFEAITSFGVDVANNSIGANICVVPSFPCELEGNYGLTSSLIDGIVTGSLGEPFRVVWSNGNERGCSSCDAVNPPGGYSTTPPPSCAKNSLGIGALNSDTDTMTSFSSWGPCDDGRMKPDFCAPGEQIGGDEGVTSCSLNDGYSTQQGTSMAAPTVTGCSALLLERYRQLYPGIADPRNSTLKAIFAHTAVDIEQSGIGPDYQSGFGSIRIEPAVEQIDPLLGGRRFAETRVAIAIDKEYRFVIDVDPTTQTFVKVTLAWDDLPSTPAVTNALINDLDLRLIDADGTTHYPWVLDPANPATAAKRLCDASGCLEDHVNIIEQVFVQDTDFDPPGLPAGQWTISVKGVSGWPMLQWFSIASTHHLVFDDCNANGIDDAIDIADCQGDPACGDCTGNGVPDGCEPDCNGNGLADSCDVDTLTSPDCNSNEVPDECEIEQNSSAPGGPFFCDTMFCDPDCQNNGVPDSCDIESSFSQDCTDNEIPDECEPDCNNNSEADICEIANGSATDVNENGILDEVACGESIIFVDRNAIGANDGNSWQDAYTDLHMALGAAAANDMIWVAQGTYYDDEGGTDVDSTFLIDKPIAVLGGFVGGETKAAQRNSSRNQTILSGDNLGDDLPDWVNRSDNSKHVVTVTDSLQDFDWRYILGFTITGGYSNSLFESGAGIFIGNSTRVHLEDCVIRENKAAGSGALGGGVFSNDFGLTNDVDGAVFRRCWFDANEAESGGAIYFNRISQPFVGDSLFTNNIAADKGGGLNVSGRPATIQNCTFVNNNAVDGGGMYSTDNIIGVDATILNSIFRNNGGALESNQISQPTGTALTVMYNNIEGNSTWVGNGNIDADPLFVNPTAPNYDFRLQSGSPSIDTGDPSFSPTGTADRLGLTRIVDGDNDAVAVVDMGAHEFQTVIYVDGTAGGNNSGSSWRHAFKSLQDALNAALAGSEIWVAKGTYTPDDGGNRSATFQLKDGVQLYGGFVGGMNGESSLDQRDVSPTTNGTFLSGDLNGEDNSYHVITATNASMGVVLDGFTVVGGYADGVSPDDDGGGAIIQNSTVGIANCLFKDNFASLNGGAINSLNSTVSVLDCVFSDNVSITSGGAIYSVGGSSAIVSTCFDNNISDFGGAVASIANSPLISDCDFSGNMAMVRGGALANNLVGCQIVGCTFTANSADIGGGVYNEASDPILKNCLLEGNTAGQRGGALLNTGNSSTELLNTTVLNNSSGTAGGGIYSEDGVGAPSDLVVNNSIVWGNDVSGSQDEAAQIGSDGLGTTTINYTLVQNWTGTLGGTNNSGSDPLFVDMSVRFGLNSPAVDSGDNSANGVSSLTTDLYGFARIVDGDGDEEAPGVFATIDRGVFEYLPCSSISAPAMPSAPDDITKDRYLSIGVDTNGSEVVAYRVDCPNCDPAMTPRYVGTPVDLGADGFFARLVPDPVFRIWTEPVVHTRGCEFSPGHTYEVTVTCNGVDFLSPLTLSTTSVPSPQYYGDLVGEVGGDPMGPPNGVMSAADIVAVVTKFRGSTPWVNLARMDIAPESPTQFDVAADDILSVVLAFQIIPYPYSKPGDCDTPLPDPGDGFLAQGFAGPTTTSTLSLVPSQILIDPSATVEIDVYIDTATDLAGYEVALDVGGGLMGSLTLESMTIDTDPMSQPDFVFSGQSTIVAIDDSKGRLSATLNSGIGISVTGPAYLGTFTFRASADADGVYNIRLPDTDRAFLLDSNIDKLPSDVVALILIGVDVFCTDDAYCDDSNPCTDDSCDPQVGCSNIVDDTNTCSDGVECTDDVCSAGVCVSTQSARGTPCEDGLFCTYPDTCTGGGTCKSGRSTPCQPTEYCVEFDDTCLPGT